jgi:hypothetical protein
MEYLAAADRVGTKPRPFHAQMLQVRSVDEQEYTRQVVSWLVRADCQETSARDDGGSGMNGQIMLTPHKVQSSSAAAVPALAPWPSS